MKNSKLNDKFNNFQELKFIDENINQIDSLYQIINNHFSDQFFSEKYLKIINDYKSNFLKEITETDTNIIESSHSIINQYGTANDYSNDFCFAFQRKMTYTCTNGDISILKSSSNYCEKIGVNSDNYKSLSTLSIYSDENIQKFMEFFNVFYSKLNNIVVTYTTIINELSSKLYTFEEKAISKSATAQLYQEYKNIVNDILSKNYGEKIILSTYNYFQKDIEQRSDIIFTELISGWKNLFSNFYK
jgi:hypothetical protein